MILTKKVGVSAVIPSFNDKKNVFRLLDSLKKSTFPNLELIVVVNGSEETLVEGKKKYKTVKWLDAGRENIGQTGCYNLGFAYAKKDNHILYVDSDVIVDKDMVSNLVGTAASNPKIGIVTPMILYLSDKNWVNQAGAEVNLITGRVAVNWGPKKNFLQSGIVQNSGTVMLIKRAVVNKIGGISNWFLCFFDPDYCLRARKEGFVTWYESKTFCFHDQSKDSRIWRPRILNRAYLVGKNRVLFMRKHGNMLSFSACLPILFGYYFLEAVKFGKIREFFELIGGTIAGFFYPLDYSNFVPLPKISPEVKMVKNSKRWPKVSILISNYNGLKLNLVIDSLDSIIKCEYPNYEVFLIDNASTDDSVKAVNRKFSKNKNLKIICNKVDMYSQGLNLALKHARGEYIAFFNNDIEYKKGYFFHIIKAFNKYPKVYLIQGKLLNYYNHKIVDSAGETMDIYGNPITIGAGEIDQGQYQKAKEILSASGSASVVRAKAFKEIGKFDDDYGLGYEDMDLALRLRLRGFKIMYIPEAVIYHKRGKTNLASDFKVEARWFFNKNRLSTMIKNYPLFLLATTLPITLFLYIIAALWEIIIKRKFNLGLTRISAIFWVFKNTKSLLNKRANIRLNVDEKGQKEILNLISNRPYKSFISFVMAN